jgi:ElaB/YqjD/DUF883 family membrane-anchored ribosome-binding protein
MNIGEEQIPGMTELADDLSRIRDDLGRLTETVARLVAEGSGIVGERVRGAVDGARQNIAGTADAVVQNSRQCMQGAGGVMRDAAASLGTTVERHPIAAVSIAAAIGFAVGAMGRGRNGA